MFRAALLVACLLAISATALKSSRPTTLIPSTNRDPVVIGLLAPEAQQELARAWGVYARDLTASEYAYCITDYRTRQAASDTLLILIYEVERAAAEDTTPASLTFGCGGMPGLHSHPPTDCTGEVGAWSCVPSDTTLLCVPSTNDLFGTSRDWHRFGVVQCGARRFLLFIPPPTMAPPDGASVSLAPPTLLPHHG